MQTDWTAQKLDMIRDLPREELLGWWRHFRDSRPAFPGEVEALHQRARELGVTLTSSSSAGP